MMGLTLLQYDPPSQPVTFSTTWSHAKMLRVKISTYRFWKDSSARGILRQAWVCLVSQPVFGCCNSVSEAECL